MNLNLVGHDDRYAVEQLQMALFPAGAEVDAISTLHRGATWLTAVTAITLDGTTTRAVRRLKASEETVRARRRALQQSYYLAALPHLPEAPAWGALSGVRPTKITTKHMLEDGTAASASKLLEDVYFVTPERRELAIHCSESTVKAANLLGVSKSTFYRRVGIK
jgi:oxygen-independent coproporphyrinogen-3 oxidase